uniref:Uncharacterized protein n=1 Tax=Oncorhynchus tshawytscha TaxID=74940 RepID=A0AAZ3Q0U7_ONCTS
MANAGSRVSIEGETMRYAEYNSQSKIRSETEIDKRLGGTLIAVGLGVAAAGFAGRYAFQLWKPLGQVLSQTAKKMPTSTFSSHYYKGGFDQKMTKREASLILGISPTSTKSKVDLLTWPPRSTRPRTCWIKTNAADKNYSPHHPSDLLDYSILQIYLFQPYITIPRDYSETFFLNKDIFQVEGHL